MLRFALRSARSTAGRLVAAGLAIALGTAFATAVLLADDLMERTISAAVSSAYTGADVVVSARDRPLRDTDVARVRALPGVAGADGRIETGVELIARGRSEYTTASGTPTAAALRPRHLVAGHLPTAAGQVALSADLARRLGLRRGSSVVVHSADTSDHAADPLARTVSVVGLLRSDTAGGFTDVADVIAAPVDADAWTTGALDPPSTGVEGGGGVDYPELLVVGRTGTDAAALRDRVATALTGSHAQVRTADQETRRQVREVAGGTDVLAGVVGAFAVLALFVAGIVITNTFAVLVAQRTRSLALLRCVGATSAQVRASVLAEAGALGLLASAAGVLGGTALAALAAAVLHHATPDLPVPGTVHPSLVSVLVPLAVGVLVTVLAALAPATTATRVAPVAALRPLEPPDLRRPGSRVRLVVALLLVLGGAAALAAGVTACVRSTSAHGLLLAVPGGALSFVGVMVGSVFVVPRLVGLGGRLGGAALRRTAAAATVRVASTNAVRNPRRTAATTSALLIGVTLVTMMTVGAASTQRTLDGALDDSYPVDIAVGDLDSGVDQLNGSATDPAPVERPTALPAGVDRAVAATSGVATTAKVLGVDVVMTTGAHRWSATAHGVDPAAAGRVLHSGTAARALRPGSLVLDHVRADEVGVREGQLVRLQSGSRELTVRVAVVGAALPGVALARADALRLDPGAPQVATWAALAPTADAALTADRVQRAVTRAAGRDLAPQVTGAAVEHATYQHVLDTLLLVVVALLAVAVLIAVIGVTNTLSLSVVERTRESAVLRAVGMTRGQLRASLAVEGTLITGVGGLLGVLLGCVYGWSGAAALLGSVSSGFALAMPWGRLAVVVAVALAAGLLASVLPARRAAKASPVTALAE